MKFLFFLVLFLTTQGRAENPPVFRLHLNTEPTSLSPFLQKNSVAGYLYTQITGTLVKIKDGKIIPGRATCTLTQPTQIQCEIHKSAKFSDGSLIAAEDYKRTFLEFLNPKTGAFRADLLFPIKNAQAYYQGKKKVTDVGIKTQGQKLILNLEKHQSEFIYTLASSLLTPLKTTDIPGTENAVAWISSGPYQIEKWEAKKSIVLKPNPHFDSLSAKRPRLEFLFIQEDSVALNLYEKGELDFLRRVPTLFIPKMRGRPDYHEVDQFRFDYIGLKKTIDSDHLRQALIHSLDYQDLQNLFWAKPRPGCIGLPKRMVTKDICYEYSLPKSQAQLQKYKEKKSSQLSLSYLFSKQGGDDHKRAAEWLKAQWKKNLNLDVELNQQDNKIFLEKIKSPQTTIFRKGLAPDRPTCLGILENFKEKAVENYLGINNKKLESLIMALSHSSDENSRKVKCTEALEELMKHNLLIPTGPIFFSILIQSKWKNWHLNELNQLDMTDLSL